MPRLEHVDSVVVSNSFYMYSERYVYCFVFIVMRTNNPWIGPQRTAHAECLPFSHSPTGLNF